MKNRVWYLTAPKKVALMEEETPAIKDDEVLVEVEACGICMYDYKLFNGDIIPTSPPYPHPHGHEAVGKVIQAGKQVSYCKPGDRVGAIRGFAFAEKMICQESQVAKVPTKGDAAINITEPATCVIQFLNNIQYWPGQTTVIVGLGYMGLLILQGLPTRIMSRVIVVEPREQIHSLAREFGADLCINPKTTDFVKAIRKEVPEGADLVVDACGGIKSVFEQTPQLLKPSYGIQGSQWGIFSSVAHPLKFEVEINEIAGRGIRMVNSGSRNRLQDNRTAAALLTKGTFDQRKLITHRFRFDEANKALELKAQLPADWIKGVIVMKEFREISGESRIYRIGGIQRRRTCRAA